MMWKLDILKIPFISGFWTAAFQGAKTIGVSPVHTIKFNGMHCTLQKSGYVYTDFLRVGCNIILDAVAMMAII